jgi:hypothetical protein
MFGRLELKCVLVGTLALGACDSDTDSGTGQQDAAPTGGSTGGAITGGSGGGPTGGVISGGTGGGPTGGTGGVVTGGAGGGPTGGTGGVVTGGTGGGPTGGSGGVVTGGTGGGPTGGVITGGAGGEPTGGVGGGPTGGTGGDPGTPCEGPNPQGCVGTGCGEGEYCELNVDACISSGCVCDEGNGAWACLPDCGGGICLPLPPNMLWYQTCGDPVCRGHVDDPNIPPCDADMMAGGPCANPGALCDFGDECGAELLCTDSDPRMQAGGCPISKRSFKDDIRYLPATEVDARAAALLDVKLAEYRYKTEAEGGTPHLGFIIDDGVPGAALRPTRDQVDLYGYTTLAVAAVQAQARQLEQMRAEMAELRALVVEQAQRCAPAAR